LYNKILPKSYTLFSIIFRLSRHFLRILLNQKEKKKMKPDTGPWFRPKTTVPGHGVGWRPTVVVGCHGVVAHRAAWPGRRGGPRCMHAGHDGAQSPRPKPAWWCGRPRLIDSSLTVGSTARARGRWEECTGQEE
jgi:hypothetical protein